MTTSPRRLERAGIVPATAEVAFTFDGAALSGLAGETIAAALIAAGRTRLCDAKPGHPRGVFCGMGVCHDCLVTIDGRRSQRACLAKLRAGMTVASQTALGPEPRTTAPLAVPPPAGGIDHESVDVAVVGAGPAGMAAAFTLAAAGVPVLLLDERSEPGGQYLKPLAASHRFAEGRAADRQFAEGRARTRQLETSTIDRRQGAMVWSARRLADDRIELGVVQDGRAFDVHARQLILATGAVERPLMVPGWTLPGVMTTGAAQTLIRTQRVTPGERVLFAGNGPLNFQAAAELVRAGRRPVALAEAAPRPGLANLGDLALASATAPDLIRDGGGYLRDLHRARVPLLYGHALARIEGEQCCARAVLVRLDHRGGAIPGSERSFDVDAVALGYGFQPATELARLLGCAHRWLDGVLVTERDHSGGTSVPGVLVAGDGGHIGGARVALAEGTLAGAAAAAALGRVPEAGVTRRAERALTRHRRFQAALWRLFQAPPLVDRPVADATLVCRCEAVSAAILRQHIAAGISDAASLKKQTRAGMGRCQGRYCAGAIAAMVAGAKPPEPRAGFVPQTPIKPVPVATLAAEQPEWTGHVRVTAPAPTGAAKATTAAVETADVAVIGAGIVGVCTAYYLARAGVDVLLLDRGAANAQSSGSNAGSLHVQLLSFDFDPATTPSPAVQCLPLQRDSVDLWRALERDLGTDLELKISGGLMVAEHATDLDRLARKTGIERAMGIEAEVIGRAELTRLAPALAEDLVGAAWCPAEGKINPMLATPAVLKGALAHGVRLRERTRVTAIDRENHRFRLATDGGPIIAGRVVVAAGAWSRPVTALLGIHVPVFGAPLQMIVTEPVPPLVDQLVAHVGRHLTLKQAGNGNLIIGGGWPAELDPATLHPRARRASLEGNLWVARRVLPTLDRLHVLRSWGAINVDIDGAPILGEVPTVPGLLLAVTSNGYTLGPIMGRLTADLIGGASTASIAGFGLDRFH